MVRNYKRKTSRGGYGDDALQQALAALKAGMSLKKCASVYSVPRATLRRHRDSKVKHPGTVKFGAFEPVLNVDFERELASQIQLMERALFGLTTVDVRRLAFELATKMKIAHSFNRDSKMAGTDWLKGFLSRQPQLSLRVPQATSLSRAVGFNRPKVEAFFAVYKSVLENQAFNPSTIWNMDESGITNVQKPVKIIGTKGLRQVGKMTSGERGTTVTVVCAMSAAGSFIPPMVIFPRKRMAEGLMRGAPTGAIAAVSDSGWTDSTLFVRWLQHFVSVTKCSKEYPQLITLDGHHSHKTLSAVDYARENGITLLTLPPHCTHKLQPLDRTFFKSLKSNYNRAADNFMTTNAGKRITLYDMAELFCQAYDKAASIEKAKKGFETTGLWPYNDQIFTDDDFSAADVTDEPCPVSMAEPKEACQPQPAREAAPATALLNEPVPATSGDSTPSVSATMTSKPQPSETELAAEKPHLESDVPLSADVTVTQSAGIDPPSVLEDVASAASSAAAVTLPEPHPGLSKARAILAELSPRPKLQSARPRTRKAESAVVITSSPYKKMLIEKSAASSNSKRQTKKTVRGPSKPCSASKQSQAKGRKAKDVSAKQDADETPCCICHKKYNEPPYDEWVKCTVCQQWYHESCGPDDESVCYYCVP